MPMSFGGISKSKVATVIVAADGTGDATDIQAGINLLPAIGGAVYIKEGTYTITETIDINKDKVTLRGAGYSTKIITAADIVMISSSKDYLILDGFFLEGAGAGNTDNVGIKLTSSQTVSLYNIWIWLCGSFGVETVTLTSNHRYWKVEIANCKDSGFKLDLPSNCVLESCYSGWNTGDGIEAGNSDGFLNVSNCFIEQNSGNGITNDVINLSIYKGNKLYSNDGHGIYINNSDYVTVNSNVCESNGDYGIEINDAGSNSCLVTSNQLHQNTTGGLDDNGTGTVTDNNPVT